MTAGRQAARRASVGGWLLAAALTLAAAPTRAETVITSHGISTFGELELPADYPHLPFVNPDAPKGGEMSQWAMGGFDSMNPFSVKGRAAVGSSIMLESLLTTTYDEIGASYCLLCKTMEYPEDRSWVIFHLRDDIRFSDGTPMTAEDVMFSYETFLTKGLSDYRTVLAQEVEKAEVLDPLSIKFTFKADFPKRDLPQDVGGLPVFSKAHYVANKLDLEESSMTPLLGSGAYVPDKIDIGKTITYRRNPDYWARDLPVMKGQSNFDVLRYEYFADPNSAFEAFKAGTYAFRIETSSKQWAEQYDFPSINDGTVVKVELPSGAKASGQAFMFNLRRTTWQDPKVREAIRLMFNFDWSNQTLFYGLYERIDSVWENSWLEATGTPSPEEVAMLQPLVDQGLLPAAILTDPAVMAPTSGADRQLDRKNLRAASALLDEAGWVAGDDGKRRNAAGKLLTLEILNSNPQFDRVIAPYVENLIALGVDARLETIDQAQYEVRTRNPAYDFDMITDNARSGYFSGPELKQFYGSETADVSVFNIMGLKSPAVDRLIEVVLAAKSKDELTVSTKALDRVLRAEGFWVPQWYKASHWVAYYDMYEHPDPLPPYALGETGFWWYNAENGEALKARGVFQ
ncbi:extracellular solute-binding protein [Rhodobacter sp. Har01]|uniref:extracellular solute-binding protein n=1 Tax=Rhodobacter sp. Har01 TaxID=2883999 RepID=UPI001D0615EF|nr:extracellular solute-binding protein [Rhodobacter sp. Har01]MCB6179557.1 extracellular solute-binding protein [Rhodobacter sp. Har01]